MIDCDQTYDLLADDACDGVTVAVSHSGPLPRGLMARASVTAPSV